MSGNGTDGRLMPWLVGILISLVVSLAAFTVGLNGEMSAHRERDESVEQRLNRIENKLDQLLLKAN